MLKPKLIRRLRVEPGKRFRLKDHDPGWRKTPLLKRLSKTVNKEEAQAILADAQQRLATAQQLLWANDSTAVLIVFQAMDAGGKDGTIKHVMSGVNPQGVRGPQLQEADRRRIESQLSLALRTLHAGPRADRHFQPLVLRRRAGRPRPSRDSRQWPVARRQTEGIVLARSL